MGLNDKDRQAAVLFALDKRREMAEKALAQHLPQDIVQMLPFVAGGSAVPNTRRAVQPHLPPNPTRSTK